MMAAFERSLDELLARASPLAAGRGLRRGRARAPVGAAPRRAGARRGNRPGGGLDPGRLGTAAGAEPRVQGDGGGEPAVRGERVRSGVRDRGARARARPRAHGRRDGALRRASSARVGAERATVADAEHGARRVLVGVRQHPGPSEPLVAALVRAACCRATARSWRSARRSPGRCCLSASKDPPTRGRRSYGSGARFSRSGSPAPGC